MNARVVVVYRKHPHFRVCSTKMVSNPFCCCCCSDRVVMDDISNSLLPLTLFPYLNSSTQYCFLKRCHHQQRRALSHVFIISQSSLRHLFFLFLLRTAVNLLKSTATRMAIKTIQTVSILLQPSQPVNIHIRTTLLLLQT